MAHAPIAKIEQQRIVSLVREGKNNTEISAILGRSRRVVIAYRKRLGLGFSSANSAGTYRQTEFDDVRGLRVQDLTSISSPTLWMGHYHSEEILFDALGDV